MARQPIRIELPINLIQQSDRIDIVGIDQEHLFRAVAGFIKFIVVIENLGFPKQKADLRFVAGMGRSRRFQRNIALHFGIAPFLLKLFDHRLRLRLQSRINSPNLGGKRQRIIIPLVRHRGISTGNQIVRPGAPRFRQLPAERFTTGIGKRSLQTVQALHDLLIEFNRLFELFLTAEFPGLAQ